MKIKNNDTSIFSKVSIIGLGYIGLPTAAILAAKKISVIGVDVDQKVVDTVNRGAVHFHEPELDILVHAVVSEGYLQATMRPEPADVFLIAVPTPFRDTYQPDLSYVEEASYSIAPVLKPGDLVILESTSPVGTTEQLAQWLQKKRPDLTFPNTHGESSDIRLSYCPERVLPGYLLHELIHNDRVIGGMTPKCADLAKSLYQIFVGAECIITDVRTAEMCKLAENSFRDLNIAFANELSTICDKLGVAVWEMIRLANRHPRVNILNPGPGVGGHCIAVDPWFIVSQVPEEARLIRTAREVNDSKPIWVLDKILDAVNDVLIKDASKQAKDITVVCLGLTFKSDVDDLRGSPALTVVRNLVAKHRGHVIAVEPNIIRLPLDLEEKIVLQSLESALKEADVVVKLVAHKEFNCVSDKLSLESIFFSVCDDQ